MQPSQEEKEGEKEGKRVQEQRQGVKSGFRPNSVVMEQRVGGEKGCNYETTQKQLLLLFSKCGETRLGTGSHCGLYLALSLSLSLCWP